MNGRRRGTREEPRKQALDPVWGMEMSKLTRDGTAEPVSRDQILRRERGQRIINFPCSAADHEQDCQPCLVVRAIHANIVLHTHTAVVTHICIYILYKNSEPAYTGTWYINLYKQQQYCTSTYICCVVTTDTADHEQVWQAYEVDPYYSAIGKWWPYLLALYINTDYQQ